MVTIGTKDKNGLNSSGRGRAAYSAADLEIDRLLGARLRELRTTAGLTQQMLAAMLGVTSQQLQKYEGGINRVSVSRLFSISKALDIPIAEFLRGLDR